MKPFVIEMTIRTVVMADGELDAICIGCDSFREIARDEAPDVDVVREVMSAHDLPAGWDLQCLPYGGDGNARLSEILGAAQGAQGENNQRGSDE